jgi:hypothetical protein
VSLRPLAFGDSEALAAEFRVGVHLVDVVEEDPKSGNVIGIRCGARSDLTPGGSLLPVPFARPAVT